MARHLTMDMSKEAIEERGKMVDQLPQEEKDWLISRFMRPRHSEKEQEMQQKESIGK